MVDGPAVLTMDEAAAILRISRSAAYEAAKRGELGAVRIGRTLRVPRHRLAELIGEEVTPTGRNNAAPAGTEAAK
jgi:excisionase family DNA binding protein